MEQLALEGPPEQQAQQVLARLALARLVLPEREARLEGKVLRAELVRLVRQVQPDLPAWEVFLVLQGLPATLELVVREALQAPRATQDQRELQAYRALKV